MVAEIFKLTFKNLGVVDISIKTSDLNSAWKGYLIMSFSVIVPKS